MRAAKQIPSGSPFQVAGTDTAQFLAGVGCCKTDSAGDEGAIFSALVMGKSLSDSELKQLKAEDDAGVINIDGQSIQIEQDNPTIIVTNTNDSEEGSLRWAIEQANTTSGVDRIVFNIGEGGIQTIQPLSALPEITGEIIIDGTTQPGYSGSPLIELDGSQAGTDAVGLAISAGNSTVKGLVINRFHTGIRILDNDNNIIQGNYIGTDITGTVDLGNRFEGIYVRSSGNLIGGSNLGEKNLISGNNGIGVFLQDASASNNTIQGNYIGTDITGNVAIANNEGIGIANGSNNIIVDNLVSGNNNAGIGILSYGDSAENNQVINNYVGTNKDGTSTLGNGNVGIDLPGAVDTLLQGNVIGGNAPVGISLRGSQGTIVENNFIGTDVTGTLNLANQGPGSLTMIMQPMALFATILSPLIQLPEYFWQGQEI